MVETFAGGLAWECRCASARAAAGPANDAPASAIVAAAAGSSREKRRFGRTCLVWLRRGGMRQASARSLRADWETAGRSPYAEDVTRPRPVRRHRAPSTGRRVAAIAALAIPLVAVAAFLIARAGDDSAEQARLAERNFAAAWSRGDDALASRFTDAPAAAAKALKTNRNGLDGAKAIVDPGPLKLDGDRATGTVHVTWDVPAIGDYGYQAPVTVVKGKDDRWLVHYDPRTIHPSLTAKTRLGTDTTGASRADILDRDGNPLVQERDVVRVGLEHDKAKAASVTALAGVLDIDEKTLVTALKGAGPKQFVEAQTLRKADYENVKDQLADIPGLQTVETTAPLAPTRAFGRAVLGGVGPATAEQVKQSGGKIAPGEQVGQW